MHNPNPPAMAEDEEEKEQQISQVDIAYLTDQYHEALEKVRGELQAEKDKATIVDLNGKAHKVSDLQYITPDELF